MRALLLELGIYELLVSLSDDKDTNSLTLSLEINPVVTMKIFPYHAYYVMYILAKVAVISPPV